ncbi:MAG: hypothetical protein ACLGJB_06715 [Blastocatellia bacterium]
MSSKNGSFARLYDLQEQRKKEDEAKKQKSENQPPTVLDNKTTSLDNNITNSDTMLSRNDNKLSDMDIKITKYQDNRLSRNSATEREYQYPSRKQKEQRPVRLPIENSKLLDIHLAQKGIKYQHLIERLLDNYAAQNIEGWITLYQDSKVTRQQSEQQVIKLRLDNLIKGNNLTNIDNDLLRLYASTFDRPITDKDRAAFKEVENVSPRLIELAIKITKKEANQKGTVVNGFRYCLRNVKTLQEAGLSESEIEEYLLGFQ